MTNFSVCLIVISDVYSTLSPQLRRTAILYMEFIRSIRTLNDWIVGIHEIQYFVDGPVVLVKFHFILVDIMYLL